MQSFKLGKLVKVAYMDVVTTGKFIIKSSCLVDIKNGPEVHSEESKDRITCFDN